MNRISFLLLSIFFAISSSAELDKSTIIINPIGPGAIQPPPRPVLSVTIEVEGINYKLFNGSAQVTTSVNKYHGDVVIPSSIEYNDISYLVESIDDNAFYGCTELSSITIPQSIVRIGSDAFWGCENLKSVYCNAIDVPIAQSSSFSEAYKTSSVLYVPIQSYNSYKSTEPWNAFKSIQVLRSQDARASGVVDNIAWELSQSGVLTFCGIGKMKNYSSPTSAPWVYNYKDLIKEVIISEGITTIGEYAFYQCDKLESVSIPSSLVTIGSHAFYRCKGFKKTIVIPSSVTSIGSYAFSGALSSSPLIVMGTPSFGSSALDFGYNGTDVIAKESLRDAVNKARGWSFYAMEGNDWSRHIDTNYLQGVKIRQPYLETILGGKDVKFFLSGTELAYEKSEDGYYTVYGLKIARNNTVKVTFNDSNNKTQTCYIEVQTQTPKFLLYTSSTQSTIKVDKVYAIEDITCSFESVGFLYGHDYYTEFPVVIDGLYPGQEVGVIGIAYYGGNSVFGDLQKVYSSKLNPKASSISNMASSLNIKGSYVQGDATITDEKISVNGKTYEGSEAMVTGLEPNTTYTVTYSLKANGHDFTAISDLETSGLTMTTSAPKVISEGNVIVAAEANISNEETNVGFEWRRIDWTDDFASNTGSACMYEGKMEGYIRNLNTSKLWKYRPYYLSESGKYYYGDWMGLDPTNTSYFEATVHTYDNVKIEGNTALVKGYALRGTDAVKVQGFKYWKKVSGAKSDRGLMLTSVPTNAITVEASGQVMNALLKDLDYSAEYGLVAFVTTMEGETFYGEEISFVTGGDVTGISDIYYDDMDRSSSSVQIVGYYDLNGHRLVTPQNGINIVRYSDGTSRKFIINVGIR